MSAPVATVKAIISRVLGKSGPLVGGRLLSAALTFALPLVLARLLTPQAFGTYKQFFLVAVTLQLTGQLGLTQSLYYFMPRGGQERGAYVAQTMGSLAILGALFGTGLYFAAPLLGHWLGDGALADLRLPLALFGGMQLAASALESVVTSEGRIAVAALAYVLSDGLRAACLVLGALFFGPTGLFWAAALTAGLRVLALIGIIGGGVVPFAAPRADLFRAQLAFALPFAGSSYLYVAQRYFSQYAVSASFDAATFALFAVASFHMPVAGIVFDPLAEVMMVQIGQAHHAGTQRGAWTAWNDTVQRLAQLLFPAAATAWLFGAAVLPILFTHKYAGSVPLFMIATFEIPLMVLPCDALLRAFGDTRFLLFFNGARIAFTALFVVGGIHLFGLPGAIAGGIASEALARVFMLTRARRFLGVGVGHMVDWAALVRTGTAAAAACVPGWAVHHLPLRPIPSLLLAGIVYIGAYLGLLNLLRRRAAAEAPELTPLASANG
jgi:O-antigen/teichoic acid export membrane protein